MSPIRRRALSTNVAPLGCRNFNGTTDRIDWANVSNPAGLPITMCALVYASASGDPRYIVNAGNSTEGYGVAFYVGANGSGSIALIRNGTTFMYRYTNSGIFADSTWVHLLATHSGVFNDYTTVHVYLNGTEVSYTGGGGQNGATELATLTGKWSVGGRNADDLRNFSGRICQAGVWNRVLTAGEITSLGLKNAPSFYPSGLLYYWKGNTVGLRNEISGALGTLDGTTQLSTGPTMIYPSGS